MLGKSQFLLGNFVLLCWGFPQRFHPVLRPNLATPPRRVGFPPGVLRQRSFDVPIPEVNGDVYGGLWMLMEVCLWMLMDVYRHLQRFFPTCQVKVVRFYVSCLPPSAFRLPPAACRLLPRPPRPRPPRLPRPPCRPRRPRPTSIRDPHCSLPDLNHDHPRPVFPAGPQPRPATPSVPCRTSTATIPAQCCLPDLNREYARQVFPARPHVGRYGTKRMPEDMPDKMP